jgi:transcriptional regulator with XRE-family HTH domain
MTLNSPFDLFGNEKNDLPNKFKIFIGNAIKNARDEAGLSQADLAEKIYKRRATLSDMEHGKTEPDASTLALLAYVLNKPLGYFYPSYLYREIMQEDLDQLENELLIYFRQIPNDKLKRIAINQVKTLSNE